MSGNPTDWLSFRLAVLSAKLSRRASASLGENQSILLTEWRVIALLGQGGPATVGDLSRRTATDKSWISRSIDRLVKLGYARKAEGTAQGRRVPYELTAQGQEVFATGQRAGDRRNAELLSILTDAERAFFFALLERLEARADALIAGDQ